MAKAKPARKPAKRANAAVESTAAFDVERFLAAARTIADRRPAAVDPAIPTKKILAAITPFARAGGSLHEIIERLDAMLLYEPRPLAGAAMLVALYALREAATRSDPRRIAKLSYADFIDGPRVLFHHGDVSLGKSAVVPEVAITGDLTSAGAICDGTSPGTLIAIAGNLTARSIAVAGSLVVGGDLTVDVLVTYGDRSNYPGGKARPVRVGGTLRAKTLVIGDHAICAGSLAADRTLELPRDIEHFITAVRAFDNKKQINVGLLRAKLLTGANFLKD